MSLALAATAQDRSTVGMPATIEELVLPGSELEDAPSSSAAPIVLRILSVSPHGTAFRYDLEYQGLDPGEHDLADYLQRKDGSELGLLPPIPVTIESLLPPGQVLPHRPDKGRVPSFGGYRAALVAAGAVWVAGLVAILLVGRRKRADAAADAPAPRSLAERLRPLVERAMRGTLTRSERAQLELSLVAYWRERLGLDAERPEKALAALYAHEQAGALLRSLEEWLHRPSPPVDVDVHALLEPYRDVRDDALERATRT
jgi:hypothetical protein